MPYCPYTMLQLRLVVHWLLLSRGVLVPVSSYVTSVFKFTIDIQDRRFYLNYVLLLWYFTKMASDF